MITCSSLVTLTTSLRESHVFKQRKWMSDCEPVHLQGLMRGLSWVCSSVKQKRQVRVDCALLKGSSSVMSSIMDCFKFFRFPLRFSVVSEVAKSAVVQLMLDFDSS